MMDIFYCIAGCIYIVGGVLFIVAFAKSERYWKKKVYEAYDFGRKVRASTFLSKLFGLDDEKSEENHREAAKWISTKDALPELGMRVIVNIKGHGKVKPYQSVWTFEDGEREVWEQWVTHWMPLPEPPEVNK